MIGSYHTHSVFSINNVFDNYCVSLNSVKFIFKWILYRFSEQDKNDKFWTYNLEVIHYYGS